MLYPLLKEWSLVACEQHWNALTNEEQLSFVAILKTFYFLIFYFYMMS